MLRPRRVLLGDDDNGFPLALRPKCAGNLVRHLLRSVAVAELHFDTNATAAHKGLSQAPRWTQKSYLGPIKAQYSEYKAFHGHLEFDEEIFPARAVSVKQVKTGEVLVRSLSRPLPPGHTTRSHSVKQRFGWQRHSDRDYADPAEAHCRKFKEKRKEGTLRRMALELEQKANRVAHAASLKEERLIDVPGRRVSINLLDLQPEPAPEPSRTSTPTLVDLLDSPILEVVGQPVLALMNVQSRIQMWEALSKWEEQTQSTSY